MGAMMWLRPRAGFAFSKRDFVASLGAVTTEDLLLDDRFPRTNAYHPDWILGSASGGANSLWLTEWLMSVMELQSGMRVLDLGCGLAASSIFLAREFGAQVWATDLWFDVSANEPRIRDAGVADLVTPVHADARTLPFEAEFFDAIISIDSFPYFGTDDHYLAYLARFLKPGGVIGIASAGMIEEIEGDPPEHLASWWKAEPAMWCLHSPKWWRRHWERSGIVDVEVADTMPDGWHYWLKWHRTVAPDNHVEMNSIEQDGGAHLGYVRVVARRRKDAVIEEPITSIPSEYEAKPLLRDQGTE